MQILKDLYYRYNNSEEFAGLGEIPEVKDAFAEIRDWAKDYSKEDYLKFEEIIVTHSAASELQGFIYGFIYGIRMMAECVRNGGTSNG